MTIAVLKLSILALLLTLFNSCAYHQRVIDSYIKNPEHTVTLTSRVTKHKPQPVDVLSYIPYTIPEFTIYVRWKNIPSHKFDFRYMVYDGQETLVKVSNFRGGRQGNQRNLRSWVTYSIDTEKNAPGKWIIELYLNDTLVSRNHFMVK